MPPHSSHCGMSAASFEPTSNNVEHRKWVVASLVAFAQPDLPRTAPAEQSACRTTSCNWPHRSDDVPDMVGASPVNVLPPTNGCMRLLAASMQLPPSVDPLLVSTTAAGATVETTRLVDGMISHACANCQRAKIACSSKERPCRRCERLGLQCEELKPIKRACGACRASKVKCDVDGTYSEPCSRCLRIGTVCAPHEPTKRKRSKRERAPTPPGPDLIHTPPGPDIWLTGDERCGEREEASTDTLASWLASTPFDARPAFDAQHDALHNALHNARPAFDAQHDALHNALHNACPAFDAQHDALHNALHNARQVGDGMGVLDDD